MSTSDYQSRELETALRRHAAILETQFSVPDRHDKHLHLVIAAVLRILLCDSRNAVLLRYATLKGHPLRIWGPYPAGHQFQNDTFFTWCRCFASSDRGRGLYEMSIEEYLDTPIGVAFLSEPFTPRNLIKWVANKDGMAHLDFTKPDALVRLHRTVEVRDDGRRVPELEIRRALYDIGAWAHRAICEALDS